MLYDIRLTITHQYDLPAANCSHVVRVLPKTIAGRQHVTANRLGIVPEPEARSDVVDFFGNSALHCAHMEAHKEMAIGLSCRIEMQPPAPWLDVSASPDQVRRDFEASRDLGPESPVHFMGQAPRLMPDVQIATFAREVCSGAETSAGAVLSLGRALHDAMQFDASATTVDTDASEAFRLRRGVCQDYSHIMILGLQALGIPAGYVSGYLRTLPPEGGVKLEGVDAMHAWVRAWCGAAQGWIEYDPTNATLVGTDHIVACYGRDYSDVAPVRGHLRSSGGQRSGQAVDVAVVE